MVSKTSIVHWRKDAFASKSKKSEGDSNLWTPIWLQPIPLMGFIVLYTSLAVALVLLWHYSQYGYVLVSDNHYSWTYGPTAILVIIVSAWRQIDFYCKALTPWEELSNGDARAERSVLLDYVSPFLPIGLMRAVRNKHYTVVATIVGFLMLKVLTVVSTGLFEVGLTQLEESDINLTGTTRLRYDYELEDPDFGLPLDDPSSVYITYGLTSRNLPYPEGTRSNACYETFELPRTVQANSSVSAQVKAFYPIFTCEVADLKVDLVKGWINATSASQKIPLNTTTSQLQINASHTESDPARQLTGFMQNFYSDESGPVLQDLLLLDLLVLVDIRYSKGIETTSTRSIHEQSASQVAIAKALGLICRPTYAIKRASLTYDLSQEPPVPTLDDLQSEQTSRWQNLTDVELNSWLWRALNYFDYGVFGGSDGTDINVNYDTMFQLMSHSNGATYDSLLDHEALETAAEKVFSTLMVQIASLMFTSDEPYFVRGKAARSEIRLQVRPAPLWVMVGGFLMMAGFSAFVLRSRPVEVTPRDPVPIALTALLLSYNDTIQDVLQDTVRASLLEVRKLLAPYRFAASVSKVDADPPSFRLAVSGEIDRQSSSIHNNEVKWWRPLSARWFSLTAMFLLPLAIIATLEVLQHLSNREIGIVTRPNPGTLAMDICTRIIPASLMVAVAALFSSWRFTISALAPYHALKRGCASAEHGLTARFIGVLSPIALLRAVRHRQFGPFFSIVAALIGSLLTIISSGLYIVNDVVENTSPYVLRMDDFDPVWANSVSDDNSAAVVLSLTESLNLSYPPFTHEELAFPKLTFSDANSVQGLTSGQAELTLSMPALRASLDCKILSQTDFEVSVYPAQSSHSGSQAPQAYFVSTTKLPHDCSFGGEYGNLSHLDWVYWATERASSDDTLEDHYVARLQDLHVGPFTDTDMLSADEASTTQKDNPLGCPSLAFNFAYINSSDSEYSTSINNKTNDPAKTNVTIAVCYQLLEEVQTTVTFDVPELTISAFHPPTVEHSIRHLHGGTGNQTAFSFRPQTHFDEQFHMNGTHGFTQFADSIPPIDNFFQAVLDGRHPVSPSDLTGVENHERFLDAVQGVYRRYMAQVISSNMRRTLPSSAQQIFTGSMTSPNGIRVRQNNASKLTLQIMLGVMVLTGALAYWLTMKDMRHALPHEPCSIATVASLLAGSELCGERVRQLIPPSAEWMSNEELQGKDVWGTGWVFSLGYWDWKWGERRRYGIDVGNDCED